jgi:hypothetical protein
MNTLKKPFTNQEMAEICLAASNHIAWNDEEFNKDYYTYHRFTTAVIHTAGRIHEDQYHSRLLQKFYPEVMEDIDYPTLSIIGAEINYMYLLMLSEYFSSLSDS